MVQVLARVAIQQILNLALGTISAHQAVCVGVILPHCHLPVVAKDQLALLVQLEPCQQRGLFGLARRLDLATIGIVNPLPILEMKIKTYHCVRVEVCLETENAVCSLNRRHVLRLQVRLDLIPSLAEAKVRHITTLVDVGAEILADLGTGRAQFHVDVSIVFEDQILVGGHDPFVRVPLASVFDYAALVTTTVNRESVRHIGFRLELFGKTFAAHLPVHRKAVSPHNIAHGEGIFSGLFALPIWQVEVVVLFVGIKKGLDVVSLLPIQVGILGVNLGGLTIEFVFFMIRTKSLDVVCHLTQISVLGINFGGLTIEFALCRVSSWLILIKHTLTRGASCSRGCSAVVIGDMEDVVVVIEVHVDVLRHRSVPVLSCLSIWDTGGWLRIAGAVATAHANGVGIHRAAHAVQHELFHAPVELPILVIPSLIWDLRRDNFVDAIGSCVPVRWVKRDQEVKVGQASLLELYDPDIGSALSKDAIFVDLLDEPLHLQIKDSRYQVRAIRRGLARVEIVFDLPPLGVASEGDEEVRLATLGNDRHGIVVKCLPISRTVGERGWQDGDPLANLRSPAVLVVLDLLYTNPVIRGGPAPAVTSLVRCPRIALDHSGLQYTTVSGHGRIITSICIGTTASAKSRASAASPARRTILATRSLGPLIRMGLKNG